MMIDEDDEAPPLLPGQIDVSKQHRPAPTDDEAPIGAPQLSVVGDIDVSAVAIGVPVTCPTCRTGLLEQIPEDASMAPQDAVYLVHCMACGAQWPL